MLSYYGKDVVYPSHKQYVTASLSVTDDGNGGYPYTAMKANPGWKAMVTKAVDENKIGYYEFDTHCGAWMTRTLSTALNEDGPLVTYITSEGEVFNYYTYTPMFIRPAMWIKQ